MRALFLTPHYPPDPAATGQLIAELVEDWVAAGHEATVVTARPSYVTEGNSASGRLIRHERRHGADVYIWSVPTLGRRGVWGRLLPFSTYFLAAAATSVVIRDVDVVYAMSTPPLLSGVLGSVIQAMRGIPFVYNLQDVYPDIAVALGVLPNGAVARVTRAAESLLRRRAAVLTVLAEDMRDRVLNVDPDLDNIQIIPNWADVQQVKPMESESNPFIQKHELAGKFVVLYSGNLGRAHGAETLAALAQGVSDLPDVAVVIIGEGPAKADLQRDIQERGLTNVRFLPYQPKGRLSESLSSASVSVVLQRDSTCGLVVPSKLYGIMASGRPVVAAVPRGSEVARIVRDKDIGIAVPSGDDAGLIAAVRQLHALSAPKLEAMGRRAREAAIGCYSREHATGHYIKLFEELGQERSSKRITHEHALRERPDANV